jgi:uncharacterized membrane protein
VSVAAEGKKLNNPESPPSRDSCWRCVALWAGFSIYVMAIIAFGGGSSTGTQLLAASGIALSFGLAVATYGWRGAGLLAIACMTVTFAMENLGIATGFPFGHYHFEVGARLPHVGLVPMIVGPLYFGVGFLAWIIASILLDEADLNLHRRVNMAGLPIIAAFVMAQWDVVMDPPNATVDHAWIWRDGGGYFGVPLSNYVSWYMTVWMFFQLFALMIARWPDLFAGPRIQRNVAIWLMPPVLYFAIGLSYVASYLTAGNEMIIDPAGHSWRVHDLRETTVIVATFTMISTSILALLRLIKRRTD